MHEFINANALLLCIVALTDADIEKFHSRVDKAGGPNACWPWTASLRREGYGAFFIGWVRKGQKQAVLAHRVAYIIDHGSIAEGLTVDHLCRNRACCNPAHLEAITNRENILRGVGASAQNAVKTHCPRGHEYTRDNTYVSKDRLGEHRHCRICTRLLAQARYAKRRVLAVAS